MIEWLQQNLSFGQYEVAPHRPRSRTRPSLRPRHQPQRVHAPRQAPSEPVAHRATAHHPTRRAAAADDRGSVELEPHLRRERRVGEDPESWRAELETRGMVFISDDHFVGSTHPDFYHSAVHAPWYVFEHWTTFFDLAGYLPDGSISQDLLIMRRREDGAPQPRPIGHRGPSVRRHHQHHRSSRCTRSWSNGAGPRFCGASSRRRRRTRRATSPSSNRRPCSESSACCAPGSTSRAAACQFWRRSFAAKLTRCAEVGQKQPGNGYADPEQTVPDGVSLTQAPPGSTEAS